MRWRQNQAWRAWNCEAGGTPAAAWQSDASSMIIDSYFAAQSAQEQRPFSGGVHFGVRRSKH
jgi:hypothetical protein